MASEVGYRTAYRRALQKGLALKFAAADLPIEFFGGVIDGPQADRDVGCVWLEGKRPQGRDGNNEEVFFQVRVLRHFMQDQGAEYPREETAAALELTAEKLEDALADMLTTSWLQTVSGETLTGWADYFTVTELVTNYPEQYVQATLLVWARNRSARGG